MFATVHDLLKMFAHLLSCSSSFVSAFPFVSIPTVDWLDVLPASVLVIV